MDKLTKEQQAQLFADKQCAFMQMVALGLTREQFLRFAHHNPDVYQKMIHWIYSLPTEDGGREHDK